MRVLTLSKGYYTNRSQRDRNQARDEELTEIVCESIMLIPEAILVR